MLKDIYEALRAGPGWLKTLFLVVCEYCLSCYVFDDDAVPELVVLTLSGVFFACITCLPIHLTLRQTTMLAGSMTTSSRRTKVYRTTRLHATYATTWAMATAAATAR